MHTFIFSHSPITHTPILLFSRTCSMQLGFRKQLKWQLDDIIAHRLAKRKAEEADPIGLLKTKAAAGKKAE
jgi:hypothetical protein